MTKNQFGSLQNTVLGIGFLIISNIMVLAGKAPSWVIYGMGVVAVFHMGLGFYFAAKQKYDEKTEKPL
jgi:hypothetical protein